MDSSYYVGSTYTSFQKNAVYKVQLMCTMKQIQPTKYLRCAKPYTWTDFCLLKKRHHFLHYSQGSRFYQHGTYYQERMKEHHRQTEDLLVQNTTFFAARARQVAAVPLGNTVIFYQQNWLLLLSDCTLALMILLFQEDSQS